MMRASASTVGSSASGSPAHTGKGEGGGQVEAADLGGAQFGPEADGLLAHDAHELGPHDAVDEPGVVLHLCGEDELAARLVAVRRGLAL